MSTPPVEPGTSFWAAQHYQVIAARLQPISEALCVTARLRGGERVLDVATATGNAALAAARHDCRVTAIDLDPAMLAVARMRAEAEQLPLTLHTADAQQLPFPDHTFDAVLSTYGAMFASDAKTTAGELLRVCRPGGRIALANWSPDSVIEKVFTVIRRHNPLSPDVTDAITDWGTPHGLRTLFSAARVTANLRHVHLHAESCATWTDTFLRNFGPAAPPRATPPAAVRELHADLLRAFTHHNRPAGPAARIRHDYLEALITPHS